MKHVESYRQLAEFGRELLNRPSLDKGLPIISEYAKNVLEVERCSIFIYNKKLNLLWTVMADGCRKIMIDSDQGIVGKCVQNATPIIANDPYSDDSFFPEIDQRTGFKTENLAVVPIYSSERDVMGALELLNKNDDFGDDDLRFMKFFCTYISGYLELALLFEDEEKYLLEDHYKLT